MNERRNRGDRSPQRRPAEGVRIIRADEAQAALDAGEAAGRRPDDELRFGDVPPAPPGPPPAPPLPAPRFGRSRPGPSRCPPLAASRRGEDRADEPPRDRRDQQPAMWGGQPAATPASEDPAAASGVSATAPPSCGAGGQQRRPAGAARPGHRRGGDREQGLPGRPYEPRPTVHPDPRTGGTTPITGSSPAAEPPRGRPAAGSPVSAEPALRRNLQRGPGSGPSENPAPAAPRPLAGWAPAGEPLPLAPPRKGSP